ncbi:MAG: hypothetical protein ABIF87_13315 [Pseudomonadota bacterium]
MFKKILILLVLPLVLLGWKETAFAGADKPLMCSDQNGNDVEKKLEHLKKQFEQFSESLKGIPESEEFKKLKKELDRLTEELQRSGETAREKIEKELLPRLKQEMEKLRERLRELKPEEESTPLEI